jgi:hypothetical protein
VSPEASCDGPTRLGGVVTRVTIGWRGRRLGRRGAPICAGLGLCPGRPGMCVEGDRAVYVSLEDAEGFIAALEAEGARRA